MIRSSTPQKWGLLLAAASLAACTTTPPPVATPNPAFARCGPDGAVDWDDNPSAPPPHCNREGWDGTRYVQGEPEMKKLMIAPAAALCLAGCAPLAALAAVPTSPQAAANRTVLDEQAAIDLELAYKGARLAAELAVDAGLLRGANATRAADLDNKAFGALQVARTAYRAGNATGYLAALAEARTAISGALALTTR